MFKFGNIFNTTPVQPPLPPLAPASSERPAPASAWAQPEPKQPNLLKKRRDSNSSLHMAIQAAVSKTPNPGWVSVAVHNCIGTKDPKQAKSMLLALQRTLNGFNETPLPGSKEIASSLVTLLRALPELPEANGNTANRELALDVVLGAVNKLGEEPKKALAIKISQALEVNDRGHANNAARSLAASISAIATQCTTATSPGDIEAGLYRLRTFLSKNPLKGASREYRYAAADAFCRLLRALPDMREQRTSTKRTDNRSLLIQLVFDNMRSLRGHRRSLATEIDNALKRNLEKAVDGSRPLSVLSESDSGRDDESVVGTLPNSFTELPEILSDGSVMRRAADQPSRTPAPVSTRSSYDVDALIASAAPASDSASGGQTVPPQSIAPQLGTSDNQGNERPNRPMPPPRIGANGQLVSPETIYPPEVSGISQYDGRPPRAMPPPRIMPAERPHASWYVPPIGNPETEADIDRATETQRDQAVRSNGNRQSQVSTRPNTSQWSLASDKSEHPAPQWLIEIEHCVNECMTSKNGITVNWGLLTLLNARKQIQWRQAGDVEFLNIAIAITKLVKAAPTLAEFSDNTFKTANRALAVQIAKEYVGHMPSILKGDLWNHIRLAEKSINPIGGSETRSLIDVPAETEHDVEAQATDDRQSQAHSTFGEIERLVDQALTKESGKALEWDLGTIETSLKMNLRENPSPEAQLAAAIALNKLLNAVPTLPEFVETGSSTLNRRTAVDIASRQVAKLGEYAESVQAHIQTAQEKISGTQPQLESYDERTASSAVSNVPLPSFASYVASERSISVHESETEIEFDRTTITESVIDEMEIRSASVELLSANEAIAVFAAECERAADPSEFAARLQTLEKFLNAHPLDNADLEYRRAAVGAFNSVLKAAQEMRDSQDAEDATANLELVMQILFDNTEKLRPSTEFIRKNLLDALTKLLEQIAHELKPLPPLPAFEGEEDPASQLLFPDPIHSPGAVLTAMPFQPHELDTILERTEETSTVRSKPHVLTRAFADVDSAMYSNTSLRTTIPGDSGESGSVRSASSYGLPRTTSPTGQPNLPNDPVASRQQTADSGNTSSTEQSRVFDAVPQRRRSTAATSLMGDVAPPNDNTAEPKRKSSLGFQSVNKGLEKAMRRLKIVKPS